MMLHNDLTPAEFKAMVHAGIIRFAGNRKLKIYGKLNCASGKRMRTINRVFFTSEGDALAAGFRPCGHCLKKKCRISNF